MRCRLVGVVMLFGVAACGSARPTPTVPTTDQSRPSAEPAASQQPTTTPALARIPPGLPLSADGPWLVFKNPQGLWAVSGDGTGLRRLIDPGDVGSEPRVFGLAAAPSGGLVSLVQAEETLGFPWPVLRSVSLPDGEIRDLAVLVPEDFVPLGDESYIALRALTEWNFPAWSPDGTQLAFAGAMDGESSDLYVYDVAADQVRRLTSGPTQTVGIKWSPDGEWIVHGGAVGYYQWSGPPYDVRDVWAAEAGGDEVRRIYEVGEDSWTETVVGWLDAETYVTYSYGEDDAMADCAMVPILTPHRLRTVDLLAGGSRLLREAHFTQVAWDPSRGLALVGFEPDEYCPAPPETPRGLRLIDARTGSEMVVTEDEAFEVRGSPELDLFLAGTETGILAISPTGEFFDLLVPDGAAGPPQPAPGGDLAWVGDGLWVGALLSSLDDPPRQVFPRPTSFATWAPDGSGLLFFTEGALVYAGRPDFSPVLVAETMSDPLGYDWVMP